MLNVFTKPTPIRGQIVPRRRYTVWAVLYALLFVAIPIFAVAVGLDLIFYNVVDKALGTCISSFCWAV